MPYFSRDDIAQIGTPPANASVGVIRISGQNAFSILGKTVRGLASVLDSPIRSIHDCGDFMLPLKPYGREDGAPVLLPCPVRVLLMPAPASYTTENVVEIHFPGAVPVLKAALAALVDAGARPAEPGEFTFRAFRGGRLSLRQAEAVEEIIRAGNEAEKRYALARLGDSTRSRIGIWRDRLSDCAAFVEAALDFSEEDLDGDAIAGIEAVAAELDSEAYSIADADCDVTQGRPEAALVGLANAGKSSLLNALLAEDVVLVSPQASTTRDSIRRDVEWDGVRLVLSDNPGYDPEGWDAGGRAASRAMERLAGHGLAVWVVDASVPVDARLHEFAGSLHGAVVAVLNKSDKGSVIDSRDIRALAEQWELSLGDVLCVSAETGEGLDAVRGVLSARAAALQTAGTWNRRELWELSVARECCRDAVTELSGAGRLELAAEDLRRAVTAFSRALGEGYAEETLTRIFSRFCIGK